MAQIVPNQRTITFSSYDYTKFPVEIVRHLPSPALQLYMYIWSMRQTCKNNILIVSSAHIENDIGISRNTYTKAFNILISQKFLIENKRNNYIFYPDRLQISDDEMLKYIKEYIYNNYRSKNNSVLEYHDRCAISEYQDYYISEYQNNYYDGGYRYPNPQWQIAGSPDMLDIEKDDIEISNIDYMKEWDEPQETPF